MTGRWVGIPDQRRGVGPNGRAWCRGPCGGEVPVSKRKRMWCDDPQCYRNALVLAGHGQTIRDEVFKRDRGICAQCGKDCGVMERLAAFLVSRAWGHHDVSDRDRRDYQDAYELVRNLRASDPYGNNHTWEADHIVPVAEGGVGCGLEGYRTLCRDCHPKETGALRRRLNDKAKGQERLDLDRGLRSPGDRKEEGTRNA